MHAAALKHVWGLERDLVAGRPAVVQHVDDAKQGRVGRGMLDDVGRGARPVFERNTVRGRRRVLPTEALHSLLQCQDDVMVLLTASPRLPHRRHEPHRR